MPAGICEVVRENHGNKFTGRSRDDSTKMAKYWKKSLNGQATVVGGHATVGRLSNNVFSTFQAIRKNFEKSRWTVTRQWSEVTRPSDDCQTTFLDVSSDSEKFWKKSLKVTRQWSEVTRPLDDCQTTFFRRFKQFGKILKKVTEGHATVVGGHATVGWLSNNVFWRFKQFGKILKKVTEGHATVVGGHATVGWLSNNVFLTFQAIRKNFEKSHWRSRDSGRRSRDRWMTVKQRFFDVSSNSEKFLKKVTEGHATVVGGHATVGWLSNNVFWRFKQFGKFLKKVTEGHATVVGGHATVGWLSNNVF